MTTLPQLAENVQALLDTIAAQADAELHFTRRPDSATLTGPVLTRVLVFTWLAHPHASSAQFAETAARLGSPVSSQAIDQRFSFQTASLLRSVLRRSLQFLVAADPVAIPILQRFTGVRVHDSTIITLPDALADHARGCGGSSPLNSSAALKVGLQLDLLTGAYTALDLADGRASDKTLPLNQAALPAGTLRLADLGFYGLELFARLHADGAFFLSKLPANACVSRADEKPRSLLAFVKSLGPCERWEGEVLLGEERVVAARLLVRAVPQEVCEKRRQRLRKEGREKGRQPSAAALALCAWTILVTNVPPEQLSLDEALVLARVRWQIELVFKLWKSHGKVDEWRSSKPERVLCEVYGKLLTRLLEHWMMLSCCWNIPERSLMKAARVVRDYAVALACSWGSLPRLVETLTTMKQVLEQTARMTKRRKRPNCYQLLLALTTEDEPQAAL